jgi:hypothetical protein
MLQVAAFMLLLGLCLRTEAFFVISRVKTQKGLEGGLHLTLTAKTPMRVAAASGDGEVPPPSPEANKPVVDIEEETKKFGLEVGMFKALTSKDAASIKPADLLKKYGAAYLITSISFAIVSYAICYLLISQGVDVEALLKKIGIEASSTASNVGTAGLAYAVHKAASPIRFPPTVALTPVVANWLGNKAKGGEEQ